MKIRINDRREFVAGSIFLAFGVVWGCASFTYPIGKATDMGSGYFPLCVSVLLAGLGLGSMIRAIRATQIEKLPHWTAIPLLFVFGGIGLFALLIDWAGLVPAAIGLVVMTSYKRIWQRPLETAVLALVTAAFVAVLFVYVLQLDLNPFWD